MATSKFLVASVLSLLLLHHQVHAATTNTIAPDDSVTKIDCGGACVARCQLNSRPNLCKRACGTCCRRCNCVPPGTSGNYDACPCYATMTTHGNRRKCP